MTGPFRVPSGEPFALQPPEIIELPDRTLCGYPLCMEPCMKHGAIPGFFNRYHEQRLAYTLPGVPSDGWFDDVGCSIYNGHGRLAYVIGVWTDRPGPDGTITLSIPAGLYAVFATPLADAFTFVETIHNAWDAVYRQWLRGAPYVRTPEGRIMKPIAKSAIRFPKKFIYPSPKKE